ncbi:MAG: cupin domain-containing protein [Acidobacteria bacterium]|nr:cupin domain-containing protein [Acidobacteriota bacterium]
MNMTIRHDAPTDEVLDWTALHALGALEEESAIGLERHLEAGCLVCARELQGFTSTVHDLLVSPEPVPPPVGLRSELLHRLAVTDPADPQVWKHWSGGPATESLLTIRASEGNWESTGLPGVSVRRLSVDAARDTVTMLIRMTSGSSYPGHRHGGVEECFVLEGDLHVGDRVLHAGDYQRAAGESVHDVQSTDGGCLLLILSSMHDELLA